MTNELNTRIHHLEDEVSWVSNCLLRAMLRGEEHAQIARLEMKLDKLWKELETLRGIPNA